MEIERECFLRVGTMIGHPNGCYAEMREELPDRNAGSLRCEIHDTKNPYRTRYADLYKRCGARCFPTSSPVP